MSEARSGARLGAILPISLEAVLVAALGALHTPVFVHTFFWPAQLLAVALLAWRVGLAGPRRAALLGLAFGTGWLVAGTWWLYISLHRYGGLPAPLTVLAVLALSSLLSLYLAAAMAAVARWRSAAPGRAAARFAVAWLLAELARGVIFTGFPWVASGYAHVDGPLGGYAPWLGVYGIGAIAAFASAWFGFVAAAPPASPHLPQAGRWRAPTVATVVILVAGLALGRVDFTTPTGTLAVTLLQGNVPQDEKFEARLQPEALLWTRDRLHGARGDLVVGPETVIPLLPSQIDPAWWDDLVRPFVSGARAALFGMPLGDSQSGYTNSAVGFSAATVAEPGGFYRYDKHHLVPFGEFIPTGFKWFTRLMEIPLGDFDRGPLTAPSFVVQGERIAPNICYEDLFGEDLAARFVDPAEAPTLLVNLSNIGWFGQTSAVPQHLNISRMRSLELQRPMLRATNTGATAVVDRHGALQALLPPFTQGVLETRVEGRTGLTPFARWAGRGGLWPLLALALVVWIAAYRPQSHRGRL